MKNFNADQLKKLEYLAYIVSVIVFLIVIFMRKIHVNSSIDFSFLPGIYSTLNTICAVLLIIGVKAIKDHKKELHRKLMTTAFIISGVFLLLYVLYHITTPETKFCNETSWLRAIYFILLITHIVLAGISFPFIIFTFLRGYTEQFDRHKRLAKWIFPIWLYVCITGPICYLLLYPCCK